MSVSLQHSLLKHRGSRGIYSVCSAQRWVLEAAMQQALADGTSLLIEATSNQVNQDGGYTGMRPADFRNWAVQIATGLGLPLEHLILGGDHLGPNPWQHLPAEEAMQRARMLVAEYTAAGFTKIHLDASMSCVDDPHALSDETVATRAAALCSAAEEAAKKAALPPPIYIIGTEVPPPGGASHALHGVEVTSREAVEKTYNIHRDLFHAQGLQEAFKRVLAIVVQPGVEFDHDSVVEYDAAKAKHLQPFLAEHPHIVFEAHSTDYQRPEAYKALLEDGFAVLKVGPALTFAMREALYALAAMERELVPEEQQSRLPETMEKVMLDHPQNWQKYYQGTPQQQKQLRVYSYSDRLRYYWNQPEVEASVQKLVSNLEATTIPETVLSQYLPEQYAAVREKRIQTTPAEIIRDKIRCAILPYSRACLGL